MVVTLSPENRLRPLLVASQTLPSSSSMTSCRPVCGSRPSPGPRRWNDPVASRNPMAFPEPSQSRWRRSNRATEMAARPAAGGSVSGSRAAPSHLYSQRPSPSHRPPPEAGAIDRTSMPGRRATAAGPAARSRDATIRRRRPPTGRHGCRGTSCGSPASRSRRAPIAIRRRCGISRASPFVVPASGPASSSSTASTKPTPSSGVSARRVRRWSPTVVPAHTLPSRSSMMESTESLESPVRSAAR